MNLTRPTASSAARPSVRVESATVRFAGDSGDGMQLAGMLFAGIAARVGNYLATEADYPSEIRAPAGSPDGVSSCQVHFSSRQVLTPGDGVDMLVAMNPAALRVNLQNLRPGGILVIDADTFTSANLQRAGLQRNPLEDNSLEAHTVIAIPVSEMTEDALAPLELTGRQATRSRNMFVLGLACWRYDRPTEPAEQLIRERFAASPQTVEANLAAFRAGYESASARGLAISQFHVPRADLPPGVYRQVTGNQALALGAAAAARLAGKDLFFAGYPITPATDILYELSRLGSSRVITFQAEDEIASLGSALGASFGGVLAGVATSGPGMALMSEAMGLAVMAELPVVILDVQRVGPSTGIPTSTEQADLFAAVHGRPGECPVVVLAPLSPADCFAMVIEAFRLAVRLMTPVVVLADAYLANSAELWRVPVLDELEPIRIEHPTDPAGFASYARNGDLSRPWAIPGTPGLEHRIGGLEKQDLTGEVSYEPLNHQRMVRLRAEKIARAGLSHDPFLWFGPPSPAAEEHSGLLVVGWGSTYGAIRAAVEEAHGLGLSVSHCHLRCLHPLPLGLARRFAAFKRVLVAELNTGQLCSAVRDRFLIDARPLGKTQGRPFTVAELVDSFQDAIGDRPS